MFELDDYYLRAKASDAAYKRLRLNKQRDNRHFSFTHMENIREVISNVSAVHCGYLLILQCFMEFGTGKLTLTRKEMPKAVGTSESTFNRFWRVVRSRGIVTLTNGEWYINPRYHFRQQAKSDRVIKLFTTTILQLMEADKMKPAELGFLYKLLPYVHYETNMICSDPFVAIQDIQFLNAAAIAELVGMEPKETRKTLDKLRKAGVVAETIRRDDKRDRLFTLNPFVFYRKKGQPDDALRGLFEATRYVKKKNRRVF
jgi:hypothetical protein